MANMTTAQQVSALADQVAALNATLQVALSALTGPVAMDPNAMYEPIITANAVARMSTVPDQYGNLHLLDSGDTAWLLTSCALVLMMTVPGLACYYGGLVQPKNYLHTVMQAFLITCLVTCIWMIFGYSLAFTPGCPVIGGYSRFWMVGMYPGTVNILATTIPESVYFIFQMTFAIITPALICGGLAERMKFTALIIFMSAWSVLVYSPVAHAVWFTDGNPNNKNNGFLTYGRLYSKQINGLQFYAGILDFAGGSVVHINSGVAALVAAVMLGRRHGLGKIPMEPHNLSISLIGASLLWVGWYGFNAGSACAANYRAGYAMATTQIATGAAGLSWMFTEWAVKGRPTVLAIISGAVAGLVVITPASGFVDMTGAMLCGFIGGIVCFASAQLKHKLGYDDALDAFGVHGVGGALGAFLTGLFASPDVAKASGADFTGVFYIKRYQQLQTEMVNLGGVPLFKGNKNAGGVQLGMQVIGVVVVAGYSGFMTAILLKIIDLAVGIRVHIQDEMDGLDASVHGEKVYYGDNSVHKVEEMVAPAEP